MKTHLHNASYIMSHSLIDYERDLVEPWRNKTLLSELLWKILPQKGDFELDCYGVSYTFETVFE